MTLSFNYSRKPRRSKSRRQPAARSCSQQFEPRCLLSATTLPAVTLECDLADASNSDSEFFLSDDFGNFYEEVIFVEPVDGSNISESFTLSPESIQSAIDDLAVGSVGAAWLGEGVDESGLQILSLSVNTASGLVLPVDIYVWGGEAGTVLNQEFLSQIEGALGDALRDVLATGSATSFTSLSAAPGDGSTQTTSADFAATYGIQPIEVYVDVDVAQGSTTDSGQLYVSGVTVVSEDPFDSEFVIVDEFVFFADDFVASTGEVIPELIPVVEPDVSVPETVDSDPLVDDTSVAVNDLPERDLSVSAVADGEEVTETDLLEIEDATGPETGSLSADPSSPRQSSDTFADGQNASSDARGDSTELAGTGRQKGAQGYSARSAGRLTENAAASDRDSSHGKSWKQRLRIRAASAARQIAEAAYRGEPGSLPHLAISAAADSLPPNWNSTLAAFSQTLLNEELFGLIDSRSNDDSPADENTQPTYAQFASGAGALLIATAASVHSIRQRRSLDRKRRRIADRRALTSKPPRQQRGLSENEASSV